jgi:hypothetical protein
MPAAIAIPLVATVAGKAISAIGKHKARNSAQQQADENYADLNRQIDANMAQQNAWREGLMEDPGYQSMLAQSQGPQVTTTSGSTTSNTTNTQDYGKQAGTLDEMMDAAKNAVGGANVLQAQQLASMNRNISGQQEAQNRNISNIAASRGGDARVARLGMDRGINSQRLNAELGIAQQGRDNTRQAWGDVNSLLDRYKTTRTKQRGTSQGTTTGPANFGAYLNMTNIGRPESRPVVQRQA